MSTFGGRTHRRLLLLFFLLVSNLHTYVDGAPQVPCYFIFGDSLADNGNNNDLSTQSKSNFPPYGIDFPRGPTGRFTNGRTTVDVITQLLGFDDFIMPFASATREEVLRGVNYASAGSGIRDESGRQMGDRITLSKQLMNHQITVSNITQLLGNTTAAKDHLSKCLYTVGMGSNDYINNYFLPDEYNTSFLYNLDEYADVLVKQYSSQLKILHSYGARKVALLGVSMIGLCPAMIARLGSRALEANIAVMLFNQKLPALVDELNELPDARFTYINIAGLPQTSFGLGSGTSSSLSYLSVSTAVDIFGTCCRVVDVLFTCVPNLRPCKYRNLLIFFDGYHPTEAMNIEFARKAYRAQLPWDAYPYDIHTLAHLQDQEMSRIL